MFSSGRASLLLALALAVLVGAGCSGSGQVRHDSAEQAYQRGMEAFGEEDYDEAIDYFRGVFTYGRDNEWADDAQLQLAHAYQNDRRYLLAAQQYQRFAQLYRNDERVPEAEYQRALSYYRLSPDYDLDQTQTRSALRLLLLFSERYPTHERAGETNEKIAELRSKLARKQLAAARQYERRELWEAAAHAYRSVFDQYPDTRWVDDALLGSARANVAYAQLSIRSRQVERYRSAIESYRQLAQIFPDSPLLGEARTHYETARRRLEALGVETDEALAGTGQ